MPNDWVIQMGVMSLKKQIHQPFYHVLVEDGSNRYAAEENLMPVNSPVLIPHREVGRYFNVFDGLHYIPNPELEVLYPNDANVRNSFKL